jgi:carbonic anhydrase/acetyltransferase-like protein (isoleucine patch superfamily)
MIYSLDGERPVIDSGAYVAPESSVIGKVRLGAGVGIWFGARLRGDNEWIEIGDGSNIQENAVLHTDWGYPVKIGRNCTIGHLAMIHGCTIGDESLIGMSATVLNGAVIGNNCLIGAGALVTEGKVIPDGTLAIGAPAKVVRDLTPKEIEGLQNSALQYQQNARRFGAGLGRSDGM